MKWCETVLKRNLMAMNQISSVQVSLCVCNLSASRRSVDLQPALQDWMPVFADCESYCKPVKGNLKINMKKYCKKDYGKTSELRMSSS